MSGCARAPALGAVAAGPPAPCRPRGPRRRAVAGAGLAVGRLDGGRGAAPGRLGRCGGRGRDGWARGARRGAGGGRPAGGRLAGLGTVARARPHGAARLDRPRGGSTGDGAAGPAPAHVRAQRRAGAHRRRAWPRGAGPGGGPRSGARRGWGPAARDRRLPGAAAVRAERAARGRSCAGHGRLPWSLPAGDGAGCSGRSTAFAAGPSGRWAPGWIAARGGSGARHGARARTIALTPGATADFRASGLAHLVAASGSNVALLAAMALALGALLGLPRALRLWFALALVAAYVPLAGGGPSIQRAGIMGAATLVAALASQPASRTYALLLAAAATLGLNPRSAGRSGLAAELRCGARADGAGAAAARRPGAAPATPAGCGGRRDRRLRGRGRQRPRH